MARIAIIGAGLAGMSVAYELRETLGAGHSITVPGDGERFGFTSSNPWLAEPIHEKCVTKGLGIECLKNGKL